MKHTSGLCARFCAVIQPFENSGMSRNASGPTRCVNTPPSLTTTATEVLQWLGILVPQGRLTCPKTARTPHLWRTACPAMRLCSWACWALLVFARRFCGFGGMTVDDEVREHLSQVIEILRPYARSQSLFNDLADLRMAITLAGHALEKADLAANSRLPPTR
jgi:hypothetical protein